MAVTPKPPRAILDFETRSPVSLRKSGTWRYSIDPHTEALCLAYRLPHWEFGRTALWHPAFPTLGIPASNEPELRELFEWIAAGGLVEAHNAFFERSIWLNIMRPRHGFPGIGPFQWRDSAVKAAAHSLPRALDDVTTALRLLIRKDKEGAKVMMKVSKPRKMRKKEREEWAAAHGPKVKPPILYHESKELFERLFAYCRKDVLAEEAVSDRLPDCPEFESQLYALDQIINERGFALDRQAVDAAIRLLKHEAAELNQELSELTGGMVTKATQRQKLMAWFETQGLKLFDTQKTTLEDLLKAQDTPVTEDIEPWMVPEPMAPAVRRGVEILRTLGRASTAKYEAMRNWMAPDDRVHGGLLFHGASTGRWSGMGVQPHNFVRGSIKHFDMDVAWEVLKHCGPDEVTAEWGSVSEPLSCALRGAITASPGKLLYCVSPDTLVLKRDLTWVRSDLLVVGDDLIGFDEYPTTRGKGNQRAFQPSSVKAITRTVSPRIKVVTNCGDITVSADHKFLARQHKRKGGWVEAANLQPGDQLAFLSIPWEFDETRDAGYLAGILDGEGHVGTHRIGWAQKPGLVYDEACAILNVRGFEYHATASKSGVQRVDINGGLAETLRLLGTLRPPRLLRNSERVWHGRRIWGQRTPIATVIATEPVTDGPVLAIETTTHTLITNGFLSHNCADYASIEARVVQWLAKDEDALGVFRRHEDPYCDMASAIYNRPINKKDHPVERQIGKFACLGLSYQMGASKFAATCAAFGVPIEDDFAQQVVETYRQKFWRLKNLWRETEEAAIKAVLKPKFRARAGRVSFVVEGTFLYCELPSGRRLAYPFPEIKTIQTSWGQPKESLTFMGVSSYSHKWTRQTTYGGMLVENCLAGSVPVLTRRGWMPIEQVRITDRVWDGVEWVPHSGVVDKGVHPTISIDGLCMTPDHRLLTTQGWQYGAESAGLDWASSRRPRYFGLRRTLWQALALVGVLFSRASTPVPFSRYTDDGRGMRSVSGSGSPETETPTSGVGQYANPLQQRAMSFLPTIRRAGDSGLRAMGRLSELLRRYVPGIRAGVNSRPNRQQRQLRADQLSVGDSITATPQYVSSESQGPIPTDCRSAEPWSASRIQSVLPGPTTRVYDLKNCGPRNRFVVAGGRIVHNCTQAVARDVMAEAMWRCQQTGTYEVVLTVHDEVVCEAHPALGDVAAFVQLLVQNPKWAPGLPVEAEGWAGFRYRK